MTLSLRAVAVIAVPLLAGCTAFYEEPAPPSQTEEPAPYEAIPKTAAPAEQKTPTINQTTCSAGDAWSSLSIGLDAKGTPTRVNLKFGGRDGATEFKGELIAEVGEVQELSETEVRLAITQTMVPVRYDWGLGGGSSRPPDMLDVRGITIGRTDNNAVVRLETVGKGFTATCSAQEAVEIGGVARKLIALQRERDAAQMSQRAVRK